MALETGTFISDLVSSNPTGPDGISQGDNHLRLIKAVLQATFPVASRAFYFGGVKLTAIAYTVLVTDDKKIVAADVTTGGYIITLPVGATLPAGFVVTVMKADASANLVTVDGNGAETINGAATSVLTNRYDSITIIWDTTEWKVISKITAPPSTFAPGVAMLFAQAAAPLGWTQDVTINDRVLRIVSGAGGGQAGSWTISGLTVGDTALSIAQLPAHSHTAGSTIAVAGGDSVPTSVRQPNATGVATSSVGSGATHTHGLASSGAWRPAYLDIIRATKD